LSPTDLRAEWFAPGKLLKPVRSAPRFEEVLAQQRFALLEYEPWGGGLASAALSGALEAFGVAGAGSASRWTGTSGGTLTQVRTGTSSIER
jgi:hypothetical protein